MYTVIGSPNTRALRVLWALEELDLPYELLDVSPQSAEILAINPSGKLPALKLDGEVIIDSVAIMQFLADKHGALTHPAGTLARARQDSFTQFICDELDGACWAMAKHSFVMPKELRQKEAVRPALIWDMQRALKSLEARVGDGPWLTGATFTVADILLGHCANWISLCGFEPPQGKTAALIARIKERPAYIRAQALRQAN